VLKQANQQTRKSLLAYLSTTNKINDQRQPKTPMPGDISFSTSPRNQSAARVNGIARLLGRQVYLLTVSNTFGSPPTPEGKTKIPSFDPHYLCTFSFKCIYKAMPFTASLKKTAPLFRIAPVHARNRAGLRTRAKGNWILPRSRLGGSPCGSVVNGFAAGEGDALMLNIGIMIMKLLL